MRNSEASAVAVFTILLVMLLLGVLAVCIVATCKIFSKAGIHPAKAFIPVYGSYLQYDIAGCGGLFIVMIVLSVISEIILMISGAGLTLNRSGYYGRNDPGALIIIISLLFLIAMLVITIIYDIRLAHAFGYGGGFAVGLIFLPVIFYCILAFGKNQYIGPRAAGNVGTVITGTWVCPECRADNPYSRGTCCRCGANRP